MGMFGIWKFVICDGVLLGDILENFILLIVNLEILIDYEFEFFIDDLDEFVFIDLDVVVGYDYIVNSGLNIVLVFLFEGYDDDMFDLFFWDNVLMDWFDIGIDIIGGEEYDFNILVDCFRIMGIDVLNMFEFMLDVFVIGFIFDGFGVVNMN